MTVYENDQPDQNDPGNQSEASAGTGKKKKKKAAKPSLLSRIRRAFTPKIAVWLIIPAGDDSSVLYAAPSKKDAFRAADALVFRHFFPHYSSWLKFHGYGNPEESDMSLYGIKSDAWREYLSTNIDAADEYLSTLEIRRAVYDRLAFSSIVRIMCGAVPLGLDFETNEEVEYWLSEAEAALAEQEGHRDDTNESKVHEEEKKESAAFDRDLAAGDSLLSPVSREQGRKNSHSPSHDGEGTKEEEKSSATLDKRGGEDHNVSKSKDGAGAKRRPGRPRKKEGAAKKTPGIQKGDSNEN